MKKAIQYEWSGRYPSADMALRHLYEQVMCFEAEGWSTYTTHTMDSGDDGLWSPDRRFSATAKFNKTINIESHCS